MLPWEWHAASLCSSCAVGMQWGDSALLSAAQGLFFLTEWLMDVSQLTGLLHLFCSFQFILY